MLPSRMGGVRIGPTFRGDGSRKKGAHTFTPYRPPERIGSDKDKAGPWRELGEKLWGNTKSILRSGLPAGGRSPWSRSTTGRPLASTSTASTKTPTWPRRAVWSDLGTLLPAPVV